MLGAALAGAGGASATEIKSIDLSSTPPSPKERNDDRALATKLTVRQSGGGKEPGLLRDMKGPAALLDVDLGERQEFRGIAGALDVPSAGKRGYFAGTGRLQLLDATDLRLSYITDEHGGAAAETRLSRSFGDTRLTVSSTFNHGFESKYTGAGTKMADRMLEGWVQWNAFSEFPLGGGIRETTHADGSTTLDLRTLQMLPIKATGGSLMNVTSTAVKGDSENATSGTLMYYGPAGPLYLSAEMDYGGPSEGFKPTEMRLGLEKSLVESWSLFAYASQPFDAQPGRVDVGATREFGGFMTTASAGTSFDGGAYVGFRVWLPLSAAGQDDRWFGF